MDILPCLSRLSKMFQDSAIDLSKIRTVVDCTVSALNELKKCGSDGVFVGKLDECEDDRIVYRSPASESVKFVVKGNIDTSLVMTRGFDGFDEKESGVKEGETVAMLDKVVPMYISKIANN